MSIKIPILFGAAIACVALLVYAARQPDTYLVFQTNPVELPSHEHADADSAGDNGHHVNSRAPLFVAPQDLWITAIQLELKNAPDVTLHHANFLRFDRLEPPCGVRPPDNYIYPAQILDFAQDQMHSPLAEFPPGYALFVAKGTKLMLEAEFHNPEPPVGPGGSYKDVSVQVTMHLASSSANLAPLHFRTLFLEDHACMSTAPHQFSVPPNTPDFVIVPASAPTAARMTVAEDGAIVYLGGHLHGWQGAQYMVLKKNGAVIAMLESALSATTPYRYDTPHYPTYINVKKGDVLWVEAHYRNDNDVEVRGAMATLGMFMTGPDDSIVPTFTILPPNR